MSPDRCRTWTGRCLGYRGAAALAFGTSLPLPAQATLPESRSASQVQASSVTIYRDEWGVPHIVSDVEEAGFYGLGYAQAQDQLVPLLTLIATALGERAAAGGVALVDSDVTQRQWRHVEEARAGFERLSPQLRQNYRYFVAGVRRFMTDHPSRVPPWAPSLEPWTPVLIARSTLWLGYQAGMGLADCRRGGVQLSAHTDAALARRSSWASNEWTLAPWRTADRAMMVLSDPHGGIDGGLFYEYRMHAGALESAGYSFGALMLLSHNRRVSWGMTTGSPDVADCYAVEVDPKEPRQYRFDGEVRSMITREVTIEVKGGTPVTRVLEYTRHNEVLSPVVARVGNTAYVVTTSYMHRAGDFDEEVYRLNRAQNVAEAREAMQIQGMFPQNVMFGDASGASWYVRAGRTPRRPAGFDWDRPVDGNTSATAWRGIHPLDDLVQIESPAQGYMQNDNIAPDMMIDPSPVRANRYPPYIFNDTPGRTNTRGARTLEVLAGAWNFTVDDAVQLALDEKWMGIEAWQTALRLALDRNVGVARSKSRHFHRFVQRILRFDGQGRAGSVAALSYLSWREALLDLPDLTTDERAALEDPRWLKDPLSPALDSKLLAAVDRAVATLLARFGTIDARYGDVFRIGRAGVTGPVGGGTFPLGSNVACAYTLQCIFTQRAFTFGESDSLGHRWPWLGSRALRLVIFTDPIQSYTLHLFGQSSDPRSPHYADQVRLASERRLKPTYFNRADLARHVASELSLDVVLP